MIVVKTKTAEDFRTHVCEALDKTLERLNSSNDKVGIFRAIGELRMFKAYLDLVRIDDGFTVPDTLDVMPSVRQALEPLRQALLERAERGAREHVGYYQEALRLTGFDLNRAFPPPKPHEGRARARERMQPREEVMRFCVPVRANRRNNSRMFHVRFESEKIEQYIERRIKEADTYFNAMLSGLEKDIGLHDWANLEPYEKDDIFVLSVHKGAKIELREIRFNSDLMTYSVQKIKTKR